MAAIDGVISRLTCQGLLRMMARPRTRSRLLVRTARWISSEEQARPFKKSSIRPDDVKEKDRRLLQELRDPLNIIDQKSIVACEEPVRVVDSNIDCLCSWNEASGSRQTIYVPGDASRPRTTSASLSNATTHGSLASDNLNRPWGYCNLGRGPRWAGWDDPLAALCATDPGQKLDNVDVMASQDVLLGLLVVALSGEATPFGSPNSSSLTKFSFTMLVVGETLVFKRKMDPSSGRVRIPTSGPVDWGYYKIATDPVPEVEDSSIHYQLLRYNLGPISCLVRATVNGSMQDMPIPTGQFEKPQTCSIHDIDVIKAGQGVNRTLAFQAHPRPSPFKPEREARRLKRIAQRLWLAGQTKLGVADIVPPERFAELGSLTVVEMAELVRNFENINQGVLRRLVGLLEALRDAVKAHGAPCVGIFFPPSEAARSTSGKPNYAIQVYDAGPDEAPVLLDWHKEHFWSQSKRHEKKDWTLRKVPTGITLRKVPPGITLRKVPPGIKPKRPQSNTTKEQAPPQGEINEKHGDAPKGFIRKWVQWLGF